METNIAEVTIFWSWNGDMSHEEIIRQLQEYRKQGVTGVFLHSRAGLKIKYLSEEWFSAIEVAIKEAEKLGLDIYFYDEDGWPSGFAGGRVAQRSEEYWSMPVTISKEKEENTEVLLAYKYVNGKYILDKDGKDIYVLGHKSRYYVDLLNPNCVKEFIHITHEEYKKRFEKYFGSVVKGIYTDEPQIPQPFVYNKFIKEEYQRRFNENIDDSFYLLGFDNTLEAKSFKIRYFEVISYLFTENYTKQIAKWCEENNLVLTGHFAGEDGLCSYTYNYGLMNHYINYQQPGIDFLGRRITSPVLLKQIQSIQNQFNKKKTLSESMGCSGWNTDFKTFRYIWEYEAAFGLNVLCSHIGAFSMEGIRKRDYPGFFSYQQPWFDNYKVLTSSFKNMSNFTSTGISNNNALLISPLLSVVSNEPYSNRSKVISTEYRTLVENLIDAQVKFDLTDESILQEYGKIENNELFIGKAHYKYIFFPERDIITEYSLNLINKLKQNKINIVFINNYPTYVYKDNKLVELSSDQFKDDCLINNRIKIIYKYLKYINYERTLEIRGGFSSDLARGLVISEKIVDEDIYYFIVNMSEIDEKKLTLQFSRPYAYIADNMETMNFRLLNLVGRTASITLPPMQAVMIMSKQYDGINCLERDLESVKYLTIDEAKRIDDNILTIDKACYRFDNNAYTDLLPVIKIQDEVFKKPGKVLEVKYSFYVDEVIEKMYACLENSGIEQIKLNGHLINKVEGYFIDKSIIKYDISKEVIKGNNELICFYNFGTYSILNVEEIFETERNRFFYPVNIENIYILGDFGVTVDKPRIEKISHFTLSNPNYCIVKPSFLNPKLEITTQNMYFYRGVVSYTGNLYCDHDIGNKTLSIEDFKGVLVNIYINDNYVGNILSNEELNITKYLIPGNNLVKLNLIVSNRNTLGPHHHIDGEPNLTGVHTFTGQRGFEDDFFSFYSTDSTWTDDYSFVRNYLGKIQIKNYK